LGFWIGFEWGNPKSKKIQTKKIFPKTQKISKKSIIKTPKKYNNPKKTIIQTQIQNQIFFWIF
jgi:hypothetical protein